MVSRIKRGMKNLRDKTSDALYKLYTPQEHHPKARIFKKEQFKPGDMTIRFKQRKKPKRVLSVEEIMEKEEAKIEAKKKAKEAKKKSKKRRRGYGKKTRKGKKRFLKKKKKQKGGRRTRKKRGGEGCNSFNSVRQGDWWVGDDIESHPDPENINAITFSDISDPKIEVWLKSNGWVELKDITPGWATFRSY